MPNIHYVLTTEWCVDYARGYGVIGVYHSKAVAQKALREQVDTGDRLLTEEYGYDVYEDTPSCFSSGRQDERSTNYITTSIVRIESED